MIKHKRWKTVGEIKSILNQYDDDCLVFIQPHQYMIDYPFYIFQSNNSNIYFRFYNDMLLPETLGMKLNSFIWKWRIRLWNLVNYKNK